MYWVYLLASRRNGTLYCGVTNDLLRRVDEHRNGDVPGFTAKYNVKQLVWFEAFGDIHDAIARETRIKGWLRAWKLALIEKSNPQWRDLYSDLLPGAVIDRTRSSSDPIPCEIQHLSFRAEQSEDPEPGTRESAHAASGFRITLAAFPE